MGSNGNLARMTGRRFGALRVLRRAGRIGRAAAYQCQCICGAELVVRGDKLRDGTRVACNRSTRCRAIVAASAPDELRIWRSMRTRCNTYYGIIARSYLFKNVKVCKAWLHSFPQFLSDMGPRPSPLHTLDRYPDPAGNYEPGNCRWATRKEQNRNKRNAIWVQYAGERVGLGELAERFNVPHQHLYHRLKKGMSIEAALADPVKRRLSHVSDAVCFTPPISTQELAEQVGATHWADLKPIDPEATS